MDSLARGVGLAMLAVCAGCTDSSGTAARARDVPALVDTTVGSGVFGRWILDAAGLPAYSYELDQWADPRARFPDSRGRDRRDHVFNFGNDRINALGFNDGYVVLYGSDRAPTLLNRFAPEQGNFAGGFGYLDDGDETWATAYRWRPAGAETRRVFGLGYFETEMAYRGIRSSRRVFAPSGDDGLVVSEVTITNETDHRVSPRHYEYWDVNLHQLVPLPSMTGPFGRVGDDYRDGLSRDFVQEASWDRAHQTLSVATTSNGPAPLAPDSISTVDWYPPSVFLADLAGGSVERYTDQAGFFGIGGVERPDAVRARAAGSIAAVASAWGQPLCLVMRHDLELGPGEQRTLRFAFGAGAEGADPSVIDRHRRRDAFATSLELQRRSLAHFSSGQDPALARETVWHSFALPAATAYQGFYGTHVTTQGSAYLYLQGIDGAPRDQALFALPLTYLRPDLARENLRMIMRLTRASDGQIVYTFGGHGFATGLLIHEQPSDLDLFFLMALGEYLAATGDSPFLDEHVPFRGLDVEATGDLAPGASGDTVLDHARAAATHLLEQVGVGENGLIRVRDGDWSDGVVATSVIAAGNESVNWGNTLAHGESVSNTGMALWVLPLAADVLEQADAALAQRLRAPLEGLRSALERQWTGRWFTRAVLRDSVDRPVVLGENAIDLEGQPWPMISRAANGDRLATLVDSLTRHLDGPSATGTPLLEGGQVWPAVSQLATWGYARAGGDLAWRSLERNAFFTRAETFPESWLGIWTGPDGLESTAPGGTWSSPVTPMTDFPALNQNPHAMALLALIRVAGIEPAASGLKIAPRIPRDSWILDLPLLRLEQSGSVLAVTYRPFVSSTRVLQLEVPASSGSWTVEVDGDRREVPVENGFAQVSIEATAEHPTRVILTR